MVHLGRHVLYAVGRSEEVSHAFGETSSGETFCNPEVLVRRRGELTARSGARRELKTSPGPRDRGRAKKSAPKEARQLKRMHTAQSCTPLRDARVARNVANPVEKVIVKHPRHGPNTLKLRKAHGRRARDSSLRDSLLRDASLRDTSGRDTSRSEDEASRTLRCARVPCAPRLTPVRRSELAGVGALELGGGVGLGRGAAGRGGGGAEPAAPGGREGRDGQVPGPEHALVTETAPGTGRKHSQSDLNALKMPKHPYSAENTTEHYLGTGNGDVMAA